MSAGSPSRNSPATPGALSHVNAAHGGTRESFSVGGASGTPPNVRDSSNLKAEARSSRVRRAAAVLPSGLAPALDILAEKIAEHALRESKVEPRAAIVVRTARQVAT